MYLAEGLDGHKKHQENKFEGNKIGQNHLPANGSQIMKTRRQSPADSLITVKVIKERPILMYFKKILVQPVSFTHFTFCNKLSSRRT